MNLNFLPLGCDQPTLTSLSMYVIKDITFKWHDLGLELLGQEDKEVLNIIERNNLKDTSWCCREMLQLWLKKSKNATWNQLLQALRKPNIGLNDLASTIETLLMPTEETVESNLSMCVNELYLLTTYM